MNSKLSAALIAGCIGIALAVAPGAAANAVSCGANACGWQNNNYTGLLWQRHTVGWNNFTNYNDEVSSGENDLSGKDAAMYSSADLKGLYRECIKPGYEFSYNALYVWNDTMSSGIVYNGTGYC